VPRRIESHLLDGPAGKIEALLEEPEEGLARVALVCHPHPLYGGTMHNKVVYRLARGLRRSGAAVLRFNFRGVGSSHGEHAHGEGELEDARTALDWLLRRYLKTPFVIAGFSFGARIALRLACTLAEAPQLVIAAGFPTRQPGLSLATCRVAKLFIQSTHDEHGPRPELEAWFAEVPEPKQLVWVEAADHFFAGGLDVLEEQVSKR
jgi:alpha/beta superfamily hydrolase